MTLRTCLVAALVAAPFLVAGVVACGEEGQSIGEGQCPQLPLYSWEHSPDGAWFRIKSDGKPLTQAEIKALDDATKDIDTNNGRCQTPVGTAVSFDQGTGGAKATGGASAGGAGGSSKAGAGGTSGAGGSGGGLDPGCARANRNGFFPDCSLCGSDCDTIDDGTGTYRTCGCTAGCPCGLHCGSFQIGPNVFVSDICVR